jgi:hypothetical protein
MRALGIDGRSLNRNSKTRFAESARNNPPSRRVFLSDEHIVVTNEYTITYDHLDRAGWGLPHQFFSAHTLAACAAIGFVSHDGTARALVVTPPGVSEEVGGVKCDVSSVSPPPDT